MQNEKMEIEKNLEKTEEKNDKMISMEEEKENFNQNNIKCWEKKGSLGKKKSLNELNLSISMNSCANNYSTNNSNIITDKSNNKIEEKQETIFKINKIKKPNKNTQYLFNEEYLDEIYMNLMLDEKFSKLKIKKEYMKSQNNINENMRAILVDWLIEVHYHYFHFKRKTLLQTILILDLFLSQKAISKNYFQLLGVASLLISAKENEVVPPVLENYRAISDNAFTKNELLQMEIYILKTLDFNILSPTIEEFYNILSKIFNFNSEQHHLGEYLIDSSLVDYNMLKYNASTIAIACTYFVMKYFNLSGHHKLYSYKMIYGDSSKEMIKQCARELCRLLNYLPKTSLRGAKNKYSSKEYDCVSNLLEEK